MSSIDDIINILNSADAETVQNPDNIVVEELKDDIKKEDEFINDTIQARKACIVDKKEKDGKNKKAAFKATYRYVDDDNKNDKKEDKKESGYGYNGYGYYNGYFSSSDKKTEQEKKKDEAKDKAKAVFREAARRTKESQSEDLFVRHKNAIKPKQQSKTSDSFKGGLIVAVLEACKKLIEIMEE